MSRRHRPPSTAREIGAYLAGARLRRVWATCYGDLAALTHPPADEVLEAVAKEDAEIYVSLGERAWWRHFWAGWDQAYQ